MALGLKSIGERAERVLDWIYTGERLPNLMVLGMCIAIAAQAYEILGDDYKEEPAAQPRVLSID